MSERTMKEIEAEYAKGRGNGAPHMAPLGVMIDNFPRLLAIAQEQRAAMREIVAAWDSVCAAYGWDPCHLAQVEAVRAMIGTKR